MVTCMVSDIGLRSSPDFAKAWSAATLLFAKAWSAAAWILIFFSVSSTRRILAHKSVSTAFNLKKVQSIRQGTLLSSLHLKTCVFFVSGFLLLWNLHFMFSSCRCIGPTTFSWALRSEIQTMVIGQLFLRFDHWSVLPET